MRLYFDAIEINAFWERNIGRFVQVATLHGVDEVLPEEVDLLVEVEVLEVWG